MIICKVATGEPINGLALVNSIDVTGDKTNFIMELKNGAFRNVSRQNVRLRFVIEDGRIYSFSFQPL